MESRRRSLVKALSWRVIATAVTTTLAYLWSHDVKVAASIGAADSIIKLFAYYLHERAWLNVDAGRVAVSAAAPAAGAKSC
jgi:adenylylsulfate kinase